MTLDSLKGRLSTATMRDYKFDRVGLQTAIDKIEKIGVFQHTIREHGREEGYIVKFDSAADGFRRILNATDTNGRIRLTWDIEDNVIVSRPVRLQAYGDRSLDPVMHMLDIPGNLVVFSFYGVWDTLALTLKSKTQKQFDAQMSMLGKDTRGMVYGEVMRGKGKNSELLDNYTKALILAATDKVLDICDQNAVQGMLVAVLGAKIYVTVQQAGLAELIAGVEKGVSIQLAGADIVAVPDITIA